ncbi:MAG: acyl carrier protein [archaeon]
MESLKQVIAKVLKVGEKEINGDSSPDSIESWDSFNALVLVSALEENFKVKFTTDEVMSVKNVLDIKNTLKKHGVVKDLE